MTPPTDPVIHGSPQALSELTGTRRPATDGTPASVLEIETKLEFPPGVSPQPVLGVKAVTRSGLVSADPAVVHDLDATYFDTEQLDLLRSKVTLRRRTGGDDAGWHLKLPVSAGTRLEQRLPLGSDDQTVPLALAQIVAGTARGRTLIPVCRLENERTVTRLRTKKGAAAVEIADDRVFATDLRDHSAQAWSEIEVELLDGSTEQLDAVVGALKAQGAQAATSASKLGRALPSAVKPVGAKKKSIGAAVLAALGSRVALLVSVDRDIRLGQPDAARHMRAVIRRIRAIFNVYGSVFDASVIEPLIAELVNLDHCLGGLRDLQVASTRIAAASAVESSIGVAGAYDTFAAAVAAPLAHAEKAIGAALDCDDYFGLLRGLDEVLTGNALSEKATTSAKSALHEMLTAQWQVLAPLAAAFPPNGPAAVPGAAYRIRGAARAMRYAAEIAAATVGDSAVALAAVLEDVQDILGEYQDATLTADLLTALAGSLPDGQTGFVFGRWQLTEEALADHALDGFADAWGAVVDDDLARDLAAG